MEIILTKKMEVRNVRNSEITACFTELRRENPNASRTRCAASIAKKWGVTQQCIINILKREKVW